jgi:NDP-sugar pyrophosphorylase family protein
MRPLTDTCPKPLLKVRGRPLITWHVLNLVRAGIKDIVINHSHLGHMIEEALGDGSRYGARIVYSHEPTPLETAGGIANALHLLGDEPFLAVSGDIYAPYFDFEQVLDALKDVDAGEVSRLGPLMRKFIDQGRIGGEIYDGQWVNVGTVRQLEELNAPPGSVTKAGA